MAAAAMGLTTLRRLGDGFPGQVLSDLVEFLAQGVQGALREFAEGEMHNNRRPGM